MKIRNCIAPLVLSIAGIAGALISIGIIFRLAAAGETPRWSDRPKFYYKDERSPSLQDYPHSPQKPPGTFRIAVVGDSYSFAPHMQFTDAFPKKLEVMLNLNDDAVKAEVINYGVPAYSTSHEVAVVEKAVEESADLILLQITLNDPELKPYRPTGINLSLPDRFGAPALTPGQQRLFSLWRSLGYLYRRICNTRSHDEYKRYFLDLFESPKSWNSFRDSVERIGSIAKQNGKPLVAIIFPLFGLPMDDSYPFYPIHEKVDRLLASLEIPHYDLSRIYTGIPLERLQVLPGVDRHPNEIAHRMAAEAIYDWLAGNRLLPEDLIIRQRFRGRTQILKEEPLEAAPIMIPPPAEG